MNEKKLLADCEYMLDRISKDEELRKTYSDINFQEIIDSIKQNEKDVLLAESLFI